MTFHLTATLYCARPRSHLRRMPLAISTMLRPKRREKSKESERGIKLKLIRAILRRNSSALPELLAYSLSREMTLRAYFSSFLPSNNNNRSAQVHDHRLIVARKSIEQNFIQLFILLFSPFRCRCHSR